MVGLVERILCATRRDAGVDTTEREQDHRSGGTATGRLEYSLYSMTPAEIKLVEEAAR